MGELLRVLPIDYTGAVQLVCYLPVAESQVLGATTGERDIFDAQDLGLHQPVCLAVEYEYESTLHEICNALGWQGGTIHQVVEEIRRLKAIDM